MKNKNVPESTDKPKHVVFADFAGVKYGGVIESLTKLGVNCEVVSDVGHLDNLVTSTNVDLCVVNLLLGGIGPFELIQNIKKNTLNPELKIVVVTRQVHKLNIQNTIQAGANDFIAEPFETRNLYNRILYHLGPVKLIETSDSDLEVFGKEGSEYVRLLLEATDLLGKTSREKMHESIHIILSRIAECVHSNRANLIVVDEASNTGVVLATSDDPNFHNFPITLDQYPEILHVIHTGNLIFVEDVSQNALTDRIKKSVKSISIGSLMVFPVYYQGEIVGVLNVRRPQATEVPEMHIMRVMQGIANIMAAHSNVAVLLRKIYKGYTPPKVA
jgi:CheY-like chemotaxis protein